MTISTQQFNTINIGSSPNDGTGDTLRTSFNTVNQNFSNISTVGFNAANINVTGAIVLGTQAPTGNSHAIGTPGQIAWDSGNVYICVATNTWKRASLSSY